MCNRNVVREISLDDGVFFFHVRLVKDVHVGDENVYYYEIVSGIYDLTDDLTYYQVNDENNKKVNEIVLTMLNKMIK